jgi:hypothetical protein
MIMRQNRDLAEHVWYGVETAINVGEPLFRLDWTTVIFCRVLLDAKERFDFEMRGLAFSGAWLSFYIKPADGFQLPEIMQWMKQTFSIRFNIVTWRTGHVWGDRYKSEILLGEPPPGVEEVDWAWVEEMARTVIPVAKTYKLSWGCPRWAGREEKAGDSPKCAFSVSSRQRKKRKTAPPAEKTAR